jgi:AcrR family transcriptional regulator
MPKLWNETVAEHRTAVRDAILDTTWKLVAQHGLLSVTMSQIAQETGIGRATLYKYFPDVEAILLAFHERHVTEHLEELRRLRQQAGDPEQRLGAVLAAYARISYHRGRHASEELVTLLHRGDQVERPHQHILGLLRDLLDEAAKAGRIREDVTPDELAAYCLHALSAAASLPSEAAVQRLLSVTMAGLGRGTGSS